jgi:exoribonuclease-2
MRARGLLSAFAPQALQEAEDARLISPEHNRAILDLRHLTWFSIDNDDTRDLDQLSVAELLPAGAARLLVAVADVDTKVAPGGAVDDHAGANTTSVYTAAGVFPMLPEVLSNDITSLHEGQERLAVVVDMQVEADGTVSASSVYRALVYNHAKLTYDGVSAWLDGEAPPPAQIDRVPGLEAQVRLHDLLAGALRQWRQTRGALNVNTVSARPVFDESGHLTDLRAVSPTSSPSKPRTTRPSSMGLLMRTKVPLAAAPVTRASKTSPMRPCSNQAPAALSTWRSTLLALSSCSVQCWAISVSCSAE